MKIIKFYKSFINIFSLNQKKEIFYLIFLSILAMILETISIASIFPFLDYTFQDSNNIKKYYFFSDLINPNSKIFLLLLILFFISVFLIKAIYLTFFTYKKNKFIYDIRIKQTNNLFQSYLYEDYLFHINNNSANLIRNLNDATLLSVFARSLVDLLAEIIMFVGIIILLLILDPKITIGLTLFFGLIGLVFYKLIHKKAAIWGDKSKKYRGLKFKNLKESFGGIRDIKILGKELNFLKFFSNNNYLENEYTKKNAFFLSLPKIWFEWFAVIAMVLLIFNLTQSFVEKSNIVPILGVFALAAYRLIPCITRTVNHLQEMKFCMPAVEPYIENNSRLEFSLNDKNNNKTISPSFDFKHGIYIKNLTYKFPYTEKNIIKNLNLNIEKGDCIGVFGKSGAGKTTFINLLLGLLPADNGSIIVDKKNINTNLRNWQNIISYIPQNVFITDEKIINNIALGQEDDQINLKKINECLKIANINDFINSLPQGVNTNCGELGDRFSGGQKQRIGIARAFYIDAEILIFDEFTNFLDSNNEQKIMREISEMENKTRIVVSHNKNILKFCKKIFELKDKSLDKKLSI